MTFITQEALYLVVSNRPPVMISLFVGLLIAVGASRRSGADPDLAPKVILVYFLALGGAWIRSLLRFTFHVFDRFPAIVGR